MPPEPKQGVTIGLVSKVYSLSKVVAEKQCIYKIMIALNIIGKQI